eukprot:GILK01003085.1.p1 GENE.GILK01003085.1~~GILK01003085.1.p1  ORF type:complete len:572 (+),score=109.57 GILK01003085.1:107-1717(+)
MASSSLSESDSIRKEREEFIHSLREFLRSRGQELGKIPNVGGRELDLLQLYREVTKRGGYQAVVNNKQFKEIVYAFALPASCTSGSYTYRQHYQRLLYAYERKMLHGIDDPIDTAPSYYNPSPSPPPSISSAPVTISYTPTHAHASTLLSTPNKRPLSEVAPDVVHVQGRDKKIRLTRKLEDKKRLVLALESGLSSEIIWALNTLTVLSADVTRDFVLAEVPRLLDALVRQFEECISNSPDAASEAEEDDANMLCETVSEADEREDEMNDDNGYSDSAFASRRTEKLQDLNSFFGLKKDVNHSLNHIEERTYLIATILRNLSYVRVNEQLMAQHAETLQTTVKLMLSADPELMEAGLDIMTNISKHISFKQVPAATAMFPRLVECLKSSDQQTVLQATETVRRLALSMDNEQVLSNMNESFFESLVNLLIARDVDLREGALEVLYSLSDLGMSTKMRIARQPNCIRRLVALLAAGVGNGTERGPRMAAGTLSNLSLAPANQALFIPFEQELALVAASDIRVSGIISNILYELYAYE